jgi:uncharacterized protein YjbJ (UPF0337 family)
MKQQWGKLTNDDLRRRKAANKIFMASYKNIMGIQKNKPKKQLKSLTTLTNSNQNF